MSVSACLHPALLVGGRCYWCCKLAALNGGRDKLSLEQLEFVGFTEHEPTGNGWHPVDVTAEIGSGLFQDVRGVRWLLQVGSDRLELKT